MLRALPYIALAVVGLYGIRWVMYYGIRNNQVGEFHKLETLFSGHQTFDILYIGTSRCEMSFNPSVIDNYTGLTSFNAGIIGSGIKLQGIVLKAYLEGSLPPKHVAINIDFYNLNRENDISHFPRYFPFLFNRALRRGLSELDQRIEPCRLLAPYAMAYLNDRYRYAASRGITHKTIAFDEQFKRGYVPAQVIFPEQFRTVQTTRVVRDIHSAMQQLQLLIALCQANKINPVIVASPSFKGSVNQIRNMPESIDSLTALADRNHIPFFDYTLHPMTADTTMFADVNHLTAKGGTMFSKLFGEDFRHYLDSLETR